MKATAVALTGHQALERYAECPHEKRNALTIFSARAPLETIVYGEKQNVIPQNVAKLHRIFGALLKRRAVNGAELSLVERAIVSALASAG